MQHVLQFLPRKCAYLLQWSAFAVGSNEGYCAVCRCHWSDPVGIDSTLAQASHSGEMRRKYAVRQWQHTEDMAP